MRSERAQGTVEYVGVLLVVATLLVALAGALGVTGTLAGPFARAIEAAFGIGRGDAVPGASQAERDRFALATDGSKPPEERPSLADIRLELIDRHGDELGRTIFRGLVLAEVRRAVTGVDGTTRFGSLGPVRDGHLLALGQSGAAVRQAELRRAAVLPQVDDPGELETPLGSPAAHVVTTSEQDAAFQAVLHPGLDATAMGEDILGLVPVVGTAVHLGSLVMKGAEVASTMATVVGIAGDAQQLRDALSPGAAEIPPGLRAGDIVVHWEAIRHEGGESLAVERTAVLRDGHELAVALEPDP